MPHDRTPSRRPAGPGRPAPRPRKAPGPSSGTTPRTAPEPVVKLGEAARRLPRTVTSFGVTRRAIILFAVLSVLALSYVGSLRVYLIQQRDLATATEQIAQRTARVAELEGELERWRDPDYVRAQARTRLGWVMPGEIGYRVIGRDGQVLSGGTEVEGIGTHTASDFDPRWWDRLAGSVAAADDPQPVGP